MIPENIPEYIRTNRERLELSVYALAKLSSVQRIQIYKYERGELKGMTVETLRKLQRVFEGVS